MAGRIEDYAIVGDMLPPRDDDDTPVLVRSVEGVSGTDDMEVALRVRLGYGTVAPWLRKTKTGTSVPSHKGAPPSLDPFHALAKTRKFWDDWVSHCTYQGSYRDAVIRSLTQAFNHVPLIQTALNLSGHAEEHRCGGPMDARRSVPG